MDIFLLVLDKALILYPLVFAVYFIAQKIKGKTIRHSLIKLFGPTLIIFIISSTIIYIKTANAEKIRPVVISEQALHNELSINKNQAKEMYIDKTIYVVGYGIFDNTSINNSCLILSSYSPSVDAGIRCYLDNTEAINSLDNGDIVLVKGTCLKESQGEIILNDCDVREIEFYNDYDDVPTFESVTGITGESVTNIEKKGFSSSSSYHWAAGIVPRDDVLIYCGVVSCLDYYFYSEGALREVNDNLTEPWIRWNSVYAIYYNDESNTQINITNASDRGLYVEIHKK